MAITEGTNGNDTLPGTSNPDIIRGFAGTDDIAGEDLGNPQNLETDSDFLFGEAGNDFLSGVSGDDFLFGGEGNDSLSGGAGNDFLDGWGGDDDIGGGEGNDSLSGGAGNDFLDGWGGDDVLGGGDGSDLFRFNSLEEGVDTITDFASALDTIQVNDTDFGGGIQPGEITADQFRLGSKAQDPEDRFIYNRDIGALYFDPDGTVSAGQTQFVTLAGNAFLNRSDIVVF